TALSKPWFQQALVWATLGQLPSPKISSFRQVSLTLGLLLYLTRPFIGKSFFSTRRPVQETGGQRPTARCALGRERVWNDVITAHGKCAQGDTGYMSSPAKAGDPVFQRRLGSDRDAAAYWMRGA